MDTFTYTYDGQILSRKRIKQATVLTGNRGNKKPKELVLHVRQRLTPLKRMQLMAQQKYLCPGHFCRGQKLIDPLTLEIDHIQPLHQGGSNEWHNLCALCANCHA